MWRNAAGEAIETRKCGGIGTAYLYATSPHMFSGATETAFARVRDAARLPLYGCDCYAYGLLAAGFVDLVWRGKTPVCNTLIAETYMRSSLSACVYT